MAKEQQYKYLVLDGGFRKYTSVTTTGINNSTSDYDDVVFHGSYGALLFDPRWKAKRLLILNRDDHKCVLCASSEDLQVHHRQYHFSKATKAFSLPWNYEDNLLITLCEKCHQKGHRQYKVPTKYI